MKKFRLLLFVDDDHPSNVYHRIVLKESGLCDELVFFTHPPDAIVYLEKLANDSNAVWPDIIFLDINMPYLNGWNFLKKMEDMQLPHYSPVVMLSTSEYYKDVERSKAEPLVKAFFCKPMEVESLLEIEQILINEP